MSVAAITSLLTASIYVPFTDRLGDGKTAFNTPSRNFLGGFNGQDLMALVPATVATLAEGTTAEVATFDPNDSAYKSGAPNVFSNDVKDVIIENPISGPSIEPAAIDFLFSTAAKSPYPASSFHTILNQPIILDNGFCQRNTYLFNESFAEPAFRTGNVTLYSPPDPSGVAGVHTNEAGYSACGEIIGFNPETCATAAARNTIGNN
ncbi:MAG: hypothetical protein M1828_000905 [Chrysothrix sp. TS-e1954]|nr:MAG: hypothetical protein M1828_000905 [Chrysothrix sp. TS-e1954]